MEPDFWSLYRRLVRQQADAHPPAPGDGEPQLPPRLLDCLLHPEKHPPVWRVGDCTCQTRRPGQACQVHCLFQAITRDEQGQVQIDPARCVGCGDCIDQCAAGRLIASRDTLAVLHALKEPPQVFALVAPAFVGQLGPGWTPGHLRAALKGLGFAGMVEVALFADILTLREALEFDRRVTHAEDFLLTSCCCPLWVAMVRRAQQLLPHMPGSVSPMVAAGRVTKQLSPGAVTVFIGPCLAKKAEAREEDLRGAVDYVLTFEEMAEVFSLLQLQPEDFTPDPRSHASAAGRGYAYGTGVSQAVGQTVARISPHRAVAFSPAAADGVPACRALLEQLQKGQLQANFIEGMGCRGGCVGGPRALLPAGEGRALVEQYARQAPYPSPGENLFVAELLHRLGFDSIDQLLQEDTFFARRLSPAAPVDKAPPPAL